ncbi:hypothetical protein IMAU10142_01922 [Lactobacillus helveticus]|uniref:Uncharacterized protein n=1 Tax=Lactococcus lactis TaxID=1358 RepID=A0A2X0Q1Y6_9LACT|nr:hypothetical protein [Lactobacillus helveticus]SPS12977.1 hypothetical protein AMHIJAGA_02943 [Lactococcus lactis]NRO06489.1 hypothetical protein [Lactobacillus helveticus]NRO16077.1 hypothetical protein [Lactobacillus helveticus]NRO27308.1 hypothetical protein [Lactobacillus helveticus]
MKKEEKNDVKAGAKVKLVNKVKFGEHNRPNTCYCLSGC